MSRWEDHASSAKRGRLMRAWEQIEQRVRDAEVNGCDVIVSYPEFLDDDEIKVSIGLRAVSLHVQYENMPPDTEAGAAQLRTAMIRLADVAIGRLYEQAGLAPASTPPEGSMGLADVSDWINLTLMHLEAGTYEEIDERRGMQAFMALEDIRGREGSNPPGRSEGDGLTVETSGGALADRVKQLEVDAANARSQELVAHDSLRARLDKLDHRLAILKHRLTTHRHDEVWRELRGDIEQCGALRDESDGAQRAMIADLASRVRRLERRELPDREQLNREVNDAFERVRRGLK